MILYVGKGGPEKLGDVPSQTDAPNLMVKNDSSFILIAITKLKW